MKFAPIEDLNAFALEQGSALIFFYVDGKLQEEVRVPYFIVPRSLEPRVPNFFGYAGEDLIFSEDVRAEWRRPQAAFAHHVHRLESRKLFMPSIAMAYEANYVEWSATGPRHTGRCAGSSSTIMSRA